MPADTLSSDHCTEQILNDKIGENGPNVCISCIVPLSRDISDSIAARFLIVTCPTMSNKRICKMSVFNGACVHATMSKVPMWDVLYLVSTLGRANCNFGVVLPHLPGEIFRDIFS